MTVYTGLKSIGNAGTLLCDFPPGPCSVTFTVGGTGTVYLGTSSSVATSGGSAGFPITNATPVTIAGFNGSGGAQIYAVASVTSAPVGYFVSDATGGTGL